MVRRQKGECTNEHHANGPIATALIDTIETTRDSSKYDEVHALPTHIEAFADRAPTRDIAKTDWSL
jgi:hypothetical protein